MGHGTCQALSGLILDAWSFAIVYLVAAKLANSQVAYLIRFCFLLSFVQPCALAPIVTCKTNRKQQVARSGSKLFVSPWENGAERSTAMRGLQGPESTNAGWQSAPRCNSSPAVSNCSSEGCDLGKQAKKVLQITHRTNTPHVIKLDGAMKQEQCVQSVRRIKNDPTWTQDEEEEATSIHHPKAFPGKHRKRWVAVKTPPLPGRSIQVPDVAEVNTRKCAWYWRLSASL